MRKSLILIGSLLIATAGLSQPFQKDLTQYYIDKLEPCGGVKEVLKIQGKWQQAQLASVDRSFPMSERKLVGIRTDSFLACLKTAIPGLPGLEAGWYYSIFGKPTEPGPYRYSLNTLYFSYLCKPGKDKNEFVTGDETGTWCYIFVNNLNWLVKNQGNLDIHDDGKKVTIFELSPKVGQWKGLTLYEAIVDNK